MKSKPSKQPHFTVFLECSLYLWWSCGSSSLNSLFMSSKMVCAELKSSSACWEREGWQEADQRRKRERNMSEEWWVTQIHTQTHTHTHTHTDRQTHSVWGLIASTTPPCLSLLHLSSWHSVASPDCDGLNRSPPASCLAWLHAPVERKAHRPQPTWQPKEFCWVECQLISPSTVKV